jgi:hypothetical protein
MPDWIEERQKRLRDFFELRADKELIAREAGEFELQTEMIEGLGHFNIEWHVIPSANALPVDDSYFSRLYPLAPRDFKKAREHSASYLIGVETTMKPRYLPENKQFYGTPYGHDPSADPFAAYLGRAGLVNGTRYDHNYLSLREFIRVVNADWRARSILPPGYRVTVCPPAVFNLVGTIFHTEWSETETLEMGFYRDNQGNATCYAVGANAPGDYSYINEVEGEGEWSLMGFRVALVPDEK